MTQTCTSPSFSHTRVLLPPDKTHLTKKPPSAISGHLRGRILPGAQRSWSQPRRLPGMRCRAVAVVAFSINSRPTQDQPRAGAHRVPAGNLSLGLKYTAFPQAATSSLNGLYADCKQPWNSSCCHPPGWEPPAGADLTPHVKPAQESHFSIGVSTNPAFYLTRWKGCLAPRSCLKRSI